MKKTVLFFVLLTNLQIFADEAKIDFNQVHLVNVSDIEEISKCFGVFTELYFNIDKSAFFKQVVDQQKEGYKLVCIKQGREFVACMNFHITTAIPVGKTIYVDNLVTKKKYRNQGYGKTLISYAIKFAKDNSCSQINLKSHHSRYVAHKFYLNNNFTISAYYFSLELQ